MQGVGFRPFVFRLAEELSLDGWVVNDKHGLTVEVEGPRSDLESFLERLDHDKPAAATVESTAVAWPDPTGHRGFEIRESDDRGRPSVQILPEIATCPACLEEVLDPGDRRHGYPFTNCTLCGPRFSIVRSLPYDRARTTMEGFSMCDACRAEYESPSDRRFHAQPNACPECGPRLAWWGPDGEVRAEGEDALRVAAEALERGEIVAVKGLGGFHLAVDARNGKAVGRLRDGKPRREKPFALMVRDLKQAGTVCRLGKREREVLASPEAPILLLPRRIDAPVHEKVAPGNPCLGIMLPYSPLHHLLLEATGFPIVATSGNLSEEPICTDESEAVERLGDLADGFLVHDRPIARHVDDSVAWMVYGKPQLLRRARGHAPRPVSLAAEMPPILAVGGHLKNTVSLGIGRQVFVSQHLGDMETPQSLAAFEAVIEDFLRLYEAEPVAIAHDLHPDYVTTRWARTLGDDDREPLADATRRLAGLPLIPVQHHHAHLAACLAENEHTGSALGIVWDGTGYGSDGTIWGGEFLVGTAASFRRIASFRPFPLPGGDAAVREPRRSALALLWELYGEAALDRTEIATVRAFRDDERRLLAAILARGVNSPLTSSAGRIFDGVSSILGLCQQSTYEGQAASRLEFTAALGIESAYPVELVTPDGDGPLHLDWRPALDALICEWRRDVKVPTVAARFHGTMVEAIVAVAHAAGEKVVALTGGCFQNRLLVDRTVMRLRGEGFKVLLHSHVPPNDGGLSLGQVAVAAASLRESTAGLERRPGIQQEV